MRVWEAGDGAPLLAIHGLGGSGRYWAGLADRVGGRFRVIAPDLAGFGSSDKPRDASYDRAFHLADLDAAVGACIGDDEGIDVTGHSLGAMLALVWSAHHVSRVRAIGLVATPYPVPSERWVPDAPNALRGPRAAAIRALASAFRLAWPLLSLPVIASGRYPGPVVRDFGRQTLAARVRTLHAFWSDPTLAQEVRSIERIPSATRVLLAHARDDARVPAANVERWRRHIPHAEALVLPEGGHQVLLRTRFQPLATWLDAVDDAPSPGPPTLDA
jgi:pimeloyl-ACP methyl ester carboxylesterase